MHYAIDTLSIEIARLHKTIREMKTRQLMPGQEEFVQSKILEFENQIRELKKAIGVLKEFTYNNNPSNPNRQYTSRLIDPGPEYPNE